MKNLKLFSIILFFFCIFKNPAFSSDKIAIIDFDVLLEQTSYGKKIISDLNSLNEQNLQSLKKLESEIKLSQDNIKKQPFLQMVVDFNNWWKENVFGESGFQQLIYIISLF